MTRHGKFLDISTGGLHLILHLAGRFGALARRGPEAAAQAEQQVPAGRPRRPRRRSGLDITEAGTRSLAVYVARSPRTSRGSPGWGRIRWRATFSP